MAETFTPGPWFAVDGHHSPWTEALLIGTDPEGGEAVAHTTRGFGVETQWANARLIAAAPDLYEALNVLVAMRDREDRSWQSENWEAARAALAKVSPQAVSENGNVQGVK